MLDHKRPGFDVRANEVIANVDVFGFAMIGIINQERLSTIVVGGKNKRARAVNLKLSNGLTEPDSFLNGEVLATEVE